MKTGDKVINGNIFYIVQDIGDYITCIGQDNLQKAFKKKDLQIYKSFQFKKWDEVEVLEDITKRNSALDKKEVWIEKGEIWKIKEIKVKRYGDVLIYLDFESYQSDGYITNGFYEHKFKKQNLKTKNTKMTKLSELIKEEAFNPEFIEKVKNFGKTLSEKIEKDTEEIIKLEEKRDKNSDLFNELEEAFEEKDVKKLEELIK